MSNSEQVFAEIKQEISAYLASPINDLEMPNPEPAFENALIKIAQGDDPLWLELKTKVGDFHWTPKQAFNQVFAEEIADNDLSVLSWALPQTQKTREDNRRENFYPSERWARNRALAEPKINQSLRIYMTKWLNDQGIKAVAPQEIKSWQRHDSSTYGFASTWSERHAAFVAGLGTFGLSDGLITEKGIAVRFSSLVIKHKLPISMRPYTKHNEYCLFFSKNSCGACIKRCPVQSVTASGRNKQNCADHLDKTCSPYLKETYGFASYGCGLCQTKVPCEYKIP